MENKNPPRILNQSRASRSDILRGMTEAARAAYMQSKLDPQLVVVIIPVSRSYHAVWVAKTHVQSKDLALYSDIKGVAAMEMRSVGLIVFL